MERRERLRQRHDAQDGASAVEFALVFGLLVMLLFGIIQFGILFAQDLAISNGAQQGARAAAVPANDCDDIIAAVRDGAQTIMLPSDAADLQVKVFITMEGGLSLCPDDLVEDVPPIHPCLTPTESGPRELGAEIMVQVERPAKLAIPLALTGTLTLDADARAPCEFA